MHKPFLYYISRIIALANYILRVAMSWWCVYCLLFNSELETYGRTYNENQNDTEYEIKFNELILELN